MCGCNQRHPMPQSCLLFSTNDNDNDNEIDLFRHHNGNNTNIKVIFKQVAMQLYMMPRESYFNNNICRWHMTTCNYIIINKVFCCHFLCTEEVMKSLEDC